MCERPWLRLIDGGGDEEERSEPEGRLELVSEGGEEVYDAWDPWPGIISDGHLPRIGAPEVPCPWSETGRWPPGLAPF